MFSVLPEVLSRQVLLHTIQNDQKSNKIEINLFIPFSFAYMYSLGLA